MIVTKIVSAHLHPNVFVQNFNISSGCRSSLISISMKTAMALRTDLLFLTFIIKHLIKIHKWGHKMGKGSLLFRFHCITFLWTYQSNTPASTKTIIIIIIIENKLVIGFSWNFTWLIIITNLIKILFFGINFWVKLYLKKWKRSLISTIIAVLIDQLRYL